MIRNLFSLAVMFVVLTSMVFPAPKKRRRGVVKQAATTAEAEVVAKEATGEAQPAAPKNEVAPAASDAKNIAAEPESDKDLDDALKDNKFNWMAWGDVSFKHNKQTDANTFDLAHLYLILNSRFADNWQAYGEIEYEHGAVIQSSDVRVNSTPQTIKGTGGEIKIERLYVKYEFHDLFQISAGKLLTPYGLINRNHWIPNVHVLTKDYMRDDVFPTNGTGIGVNGIQTFSKFEVSYAAHLTNGRGDQPDRVDGNKLKAIDADVQMKYLGLVDLTLGSSVRRDELSYGIETPVIGYVQVQKWGVDLSGAYVKVTENRAYEGYYGQAGYYILTDRLFSYYRYDFRTDSKDSTVKERHIANLSFKPVTQVKIVAEYIYTVKPVISNDILINVSWLF
jgi:hypothetical protein